MFNVYSEFFTKQFIGGRWVDSASAELTDIENPALMQPFAKIPRWLSGRCRGRH